MGVLSEMELRSRLLEPELSTLLPVCSSRPVDVETGNPLLLLDLVHSHLRKGCLPPDLLSSRGFLLSDLGRYPRESPRRNEVFGRKEWGR